MIAYDFRDESSDHDSGGYNKYRTELYVDLV